MVKMLFMFYYGVIQFFIVEWMEFRTIFLGQKHAPNNLTLNVRCFISIIYFKNEQIYNILYSTMIFEARETEMVQYVKDNVNDICRKMKANLNSVENSDCGVALFPSENSFLDEKTLNVLHSDFDFHMFCLNKEGKSKLFLG